VAISFYIPGMIAVAISIRSPPPSPTSAPELRTNLQLCTPRAWFRKPGFTTVTSAKEWTRSDIASLRVTRGRAAVMGGGLVGSTASWSNAHSTAPRWVTGGLRLTWFWWMPRNYAIRTRAQKKRRVANNAATRRVGLV